MGIKEFFTGGEAEEKAVQRLIDKYGKPNPREVETQQDMDDSKIVIKYTRRRFIGLAVAIAVPVGVVSHFEKDKCINTLELDNKD